MARRDNVTGIPMLSIGTTKNSEGYVLRRYCVNYKNDSGLPVCKSFYISKNQSQFAAFIKACNFLTELGYKPGGARKLKRIYEEYGHESLIDF